VSSSAPTEPRLLGRYALHDEVASGGMASVHLGRLLGPVGFARTVAIKRLHPQFAKDPAFVAMFLDEARLASRIRHPNVVPTLDVVNLEDELFLVMEYVHGDSLARLQRFARARNEQIPIEVAVGVISHALHGLHAAHEAKSERGTHLEIVHRDVSPQNILVGTDGVGRVLDFGIAKATSRLQVTVEGQLKGKLAYMAPEQLEHHDVDRRVDVWAAAVVLWELLVGRRLFTGDHPARLMKSVLTHEVVRPSDIEGDIPRELDEVVMRGLSRDPDGRWSTAEDMAIALEATGYVATQHAIGKWVERVATESLATRGDRLAEIEGSALTGPNISLEAITGPRALGTVSKPTTLPSDGTFASTEQDIRSPHPARRRWVMAAAAFALIATVSFAVFRTNEPPKTPAAEPAPLPTPSATPTPAPAPAPAPAPSATPSPSPTPHKIAPVKAPAPRPARPPSNACNPPYTVGTDGVKKPKLECL
jgi:eukaryotic-like serine/threonine-protein kinase